MSPQDDYWIWDESRRDYYHAELDRNGDWQYTWAKCTPRVSYVPPPNGQLPQQTPRAPGTEMYTYKQTTPIPKQTRASQNPVSTYPGSGSNGYLQAPTLKLAALSIGSSSGSSAGRQGNYHMHLTDVAPGTRHIANQVQEVPNLAPTAGLAQHNAFSLGRNNLDPELYKQIPYKTYKFFVVGKVFMMLYIENAGPPNPGQTVFEGTNFTTVAYGEVAHHQFRRFVVVEEHSDQLFCYCCPITTYSGRATTKPGVKQSAHTIVYTGKKPPEKLEGENKMNKDPLRIIPHSPDEKLDRLSRINLGKVQTIEHNWKVREIGDVEPKCLKKLVQYHKSVRDW